MSKTRGWFSFLPSPKVSDPLSSLIGYLSTYFTSKPDKPDWGKRLELKIEIKHQQRTYMQQELTHCQQTTQQIKEALEQERKALNKILLSFFPDLGLDDLNNPEKMKKCLEELKVRAQLGQLNPSEACTDSAPSSPSLNRIT